MYSKIGWRAALLLSHHKIITITVITKIRTQEGTLGDDGCVSDIDFVSGFTDAYDLQTHQVVYINYVWLLYVKFFKTTFSCGYGS